MKSTLGCRLLTLSSKFQKVEQATFKQSGSVDKQNIFSKETKNFWKK